ncbi:hypothetical protein JHK87_010259 [Glycine soja]|nr:hypothetical protein JHK87_010259 [Glycine soja]
MKEMSKFRNRVQQAAQKHNKKGGSKTDSHKRHKPDKCQPLPKGPSYGHNTEDCWALKNKIEELIQVGYLAQFIKRLDNHPTRARPGGHQEDQHRNHDVDGRRDKAEDRGR